MNEMLKKEEIFLNDIRGIINSARQNAVRSVDFCRVQMYWHMGSRCIGTWANVFLRKSSRGKTVPITGRIS